MGIEHRKVQSVAKLIQSRGKPLDKIVLDTMKTISDIVGGTLGPGGMPVLIERYENNLPPVVTKDGVTVYRSLGFNNSIAHCIMEAARDASIRTASEAGDGPQPLWSKILTPTGFVPMADIRVGMDVCGTNGTIQKVLGVFPKGEKEIVRITFEQGQVVECCEDHLWSATTSYGSSKTLTAKDMISDFKTVESDGHTRYRYFIPSTVVEFADTGALPLDPYLVGVLLGDGSLSDSGSIELSLGMPKEHILGKLTLPPGAAATTTVCEDSNSFRTKLSGIRHLVDEIGLRNSDSYTKFIPPQYLMSSVENRSALLQGLLDTDGHINVRGRFEFSTVSNQLAEDFLFLCRSLGKTVYHSRYERKDGDGSYSDRPIHRFCELKGNQYGLKISNIERTGKFTPMQCIKVSNPDNLYITDEFVVTHNTTTATILSEAIVREMHAFCRANPRISPQRVVRHLERTFQDFVVPAIKESARHASLDDDEGVKLLRNVALVSANGDEELADAVMKCFEVTGDDGNVTISESSGYSGTEVEEINGFSIGMGYEESCFKFYPAFINDPGTQRTIMEKPVFLLYHGRLNEIQTIAMLMQKIGLAREVGGPHNVVICAIGFSETVLANLATNFMDPESINVFPLAVPKSPQSNSQLQFLQDLQAITGSKILDPLSAPIEQAQLEDLGTGVDGFEASRFRSTVLGYADDTLLAMRVQELKRQMDNPESELDAIILGERIAKLAGGIAHLKVIGSSNGELKERRDRAEDAVCAVRGAIKHGCLPGGAWMLLRLAATLPSDEIIDGVLRPAFLVPFRRLMENCGVVDPQEILDICKPVCDAAKNNEPLVYDFLNSKHVNAFEGGILDSTPAVLQAIRNSISIAALLGTLGGAVVFARDADLEKSEARATADWMRAINHKEEDGDVLE